MDATEFVTLVLLATGGEIRGKTKLQKTVYFLGLITGRLEELGYRAHFYGPYSDDVANAMTQLKTIGAIDQNISDWGYDRSGFEVRRYDYRLNAPGHDYASAVAKRNPDLWEKLRAAFQVYQRAGDKDYMSLSIAAKTYFLLGQRKGKSKLKEIAALAPRFGWDVSESQVQDAAKYLEKLELINVAAN